MVEKERIDDFLNILDIKLLDSQKEILIKMINDPDRQKTIVFARGSGYSAYKHLAIMFRAFLEACNKAKSIDDIRYEIRNKPRLSPTIGGKPITIIFDEVITK